MRNIFGKRVALASMALLLAFPGCKDDAKAPDSADQAAVSAVEGEQSIEQLRAYIASQEVLMEAALAEAAASRGPGHPVVWTMSDEDTTIHFLGTVHLLRPDVEWMTDEIEAAISAADTIVFEADVSSEAASQEMMKFVSDRAMFKDGTRLNDLLSDAEEQLVQEALEDVSMSLDLVQTLKPWFASVTIQQMKMMQDGFDPESGVESVIRATVPEKNYQYLETVDQQLGRIASLPDDDQVDFLILSAGSSSESDELLDDLVAEWSDGDVKGLGLLVGNEETFGSDAIYDAMLKARNQDWIPRLEAMLDTPGNTFVAVGAAHLAGDDSVIEMLRARGHTVTGP